MGLFFSKWKKISRVTDQDKAILQLKLQRDNLKIFQLRIENVLENDRLLVKRLLSDGKKERAKLLLRKKRYQEQLLEKTDNQLQNLEKLTEDIEFAQIETKVVEGLQVGNVALKKLNETLNINDIEKILDETKDGIDKQEEINYLLSGVLNDADEEAVEDELLQLMKPETVLPELPNVPDEPVSTDKTKKKAKEVMVAA